MRSYNYYGLHARFLLDLSKNEICFGDEASYLVECADLIEELYENIYKLQKRVKELSK